jgi:hypothetical protein
MKLRLGNHVYRGDCNVQVDNNPFHDNHFVTVTFDETMGQPRRQIELMPAEANMLADYLKATAKAAQIIMEADKEDEHEQVNG